MVLGWMYNDMKAGLTEWPEKLGDQIVVVVHFPEAETLQVLLQSRRYGSINISMAVQHVHHEKDEGLSPTVSEGVTGSVCAGKYLTTSSLGENPWF